MCYTKKTRQNIAHNSRSRLNTECSLPGRSITLPLIGLRRAVRFLLGYAGAQAAKEAAVRQYKYLTRPKRMGIALQYEELVSLDNRVLKIIPQRVRHGQRILASPPNIVSYFQKEPENSQMTSLVSL